jgi:hypothetical protein
LAPSTISAVRGPLPGSAEQAVSARPIAALLSRFRQAVVRWGLIAC